MLCQEIMKRDVRSVAELDVVLVAARLMRDHDLGFLPVCDEAQRVVGIVTDRDLAVRVCAMNARPAAVAVTSIMSRGVVACRTTHSVAHAEAIMRRHRVTRLVVLDEDGRLAGVLSLSDIAQYERPALLGRTLRVIAERKYAPERP